MTCAAARAAARLTICTARLTTVFAVVVAAVVAASCAACVSPSMTTSTNDPFASAARLPGIETATVVQILDGDTLDVRIGVDVQRVRLVQIDAPEAVDPPECHGREAEAVLSRMAPAHSTVRLESDAGLDAIDRHGRLLRYVFLDGSNLNLRLVELGAAAPYFYRGDRGRYAATLLAAAGAARSYRVGLWGACPDALLDPDRALDSGPAGG